MLHTKRLKRVELATDAKPAVEGIFSDAWSILKGRKKKEPVKTELKRHSPLLDFMKAANAAKTPFTKYLKDSLFKTLLDSNWVEENLKDNPKQYSCRVAYVGGRANSNTQDLVAGLMEAEKVSRQVNSLMLGNTKLRQSIVAKMSSASTAEEVDKIFMEHRDRLITDQEAYLKSKGVRSIAGIIASPDEIHWPYGIDGGMASEIHYQNGLRIDGPTKRNARLFASDMIKVLDVYMDSGERAYLSEVNDYDHLRVDIEDLEHSNEIMEYVFGTHDRLGSNDGPSDYLERASGELLDSMLEVIGF